MTTFANQQKDNFKKNFIRSRASVAHACNPSYSGNRGQED
jgi:hypothetical protein